MNIQFNSQSVSRPNFTGGFNVNWLKEIIPGTKVSKNLTNFDKIFFRSYVSSKPYMMGLSPEEIAELNKYEGKEFIYNAYDALSKKLAIGKNIRPALYIKEVPGDAAAMYVNLMNIICVDPQKMKNLSKTELFGFIRHELQHYIQNVRVLRHEELGPKSIDLAVKKYFETEKQAIIHVCTNFSDPEIHNLAFSQNQQNPYLLAQSLMIAKRCLLTGDMNTFNKICEQSTQEYLKQLIALRDNIVKELGVIKKDSPLTPKIESDFKELHELGYFNPDGTINSSKYVKSKIENEAYDAQGAASFEFSQEPCFMRFVKNQYNKELQNEATIKFLNEVCQ